jgi:hypothetical protein
MRHRVNEALPPVVDDANQLARQALDLTQTMSAT